ncbi:hypothetical protein C8F01DRAFT_1105150, partial [Mycena amicta]
METPFLPLLKSNYPPTPLQKTQVQDILRDKRQALSELDTKISATRGILQAFEHQRAQLSTETAEFCAILSPVRLVPPEILSEVFCHLAPTLPLASDPQREQVEHPPWALALVCRSWRAVALSLPQLWSTLDIRVPSVPLPPHHYEEGRTTPFYHEQQVHFIGGCNIESTLEWMIASIRRSGNRPLSFRLWADHDTAGILLDVLLRYSARWYRVLFIGLSRSLGRRLCQNFWSLREIVFADCKGLAVDFSAPRLSGFGVTAPEYIDNFDLPWLGLTEFSESSSFFSFGDMSLAEKLSTYSRLSNLVVLRLNLCLRIDSHQRPSNPITMPHLRIACFSYHMIYSSSRNKDIMVFFDTPVLEACSIESTRQTSDSLSQLLPRSPHLRILRLSLLKPTKLQCHEIQSALRMYPELSELSIDIPSRISSAFLREMSGAVAQHRPLFPKLHTLRISDRSLLYDDPSDEWTTMKDLVVCLVKSRFCPGLSSSAMLRFRLVDVPSTTEHWPSASEEDAEKVLWGARQDVHTALNQIREESGWDIKFGNECTLPRWDDLTLSDL